MTAQKDPKFEDVQWHGDPAASGYRYRAFVESPLGEFAELCVYEKEGDWCLGLPQTQYPWVATGKSTGLEAGKQRVFDVWLVMRDARGLP